MSCARADDCPQERTSAVERSVRDAATRHDIGVRPAIRPGLGIFRRGPAHLQLGAAPGAGPVLGDRPGLLEFLRLLDGVRDTATVGCLARERIPDLADPPEALIAALERAGVVVDATAWDAVDSALRDEARALASAGVRPDEAGCRLARRSQARIEIRSDPAAEALVAMTVQCLSEIGIESVRAPAPGATAALVVSRGPGSRTEFGSLLRDGVPHLAVGVDGPVIHIGPFVHPLVTACVECADLYRAEWDPGWPAVVPQLGTPLAPLEAAEPSAVSATTRAAAVAVVSEEIATFCDDLEPVTAARTIAIGPGVHDRAETVLDQHPDCSCRT